MSLCGAKAPACQQSADMYICTYSVREFRGKCRRESSGRWMHIHIPVQPLLRHGAGKVCECHDVVERSVYNVVCNYSPIGLKWPEPVWLSTFLE
jgi:hypothetical protein